MNDYPRDLVGYGKNPPHAAWPNDSRIALSFVLNYEEASAVFCMVTPNQKPFSRRCLLL